MAERPMPVAGPRPPKNPPELTQTGEFRAVVEPMLKAHDNKLTMRSIAVAVAAVAAGVSSGLLFLDNRVAAQVDAGVRVQAAEQRAIEVRVQTLEKRFDRFDQKMDLLLDAQRVPLSKRPPPLDGGEP